MKVGERGTDPASTNRENMTSKEIVLMQLKKKNNPNLKLTRFLLGHNANSQSSSNTSARTKPSTSRNSNCLFR
jgi:hypothetical protein